MSETASALVDALDTFRPRWKSLEDDASNLATHAIRSTGRQAGDISGLPALHAGRGPAFDGLVALYFDQGRADLVEAHYRINEWGAGLPDRTMRRRFHQFASRGHGASAVRCWQHYIRKNAAMFWQDARDLAAVGRRLGKDPSVQGASERPALRRGRDPDAPVRSCPGGPSPAQR